MLPISVLSTAIMLAPLVMGLAIGRDLDDILAWTIMGALPVLIATIAHRTKDRAGAAWWFISFIVMVFFYRVSALSASPPADNPLYVGLVCALMFGALPMLVIVAPIRWRSLWLIAGMMAVLTGMMLFTDVAERATARDFSYDVPFLGVILLSLTVYLVPSIIAEYRHQSASLAIFVLNILVGWTLLGWIAALVWACTSVPMGRHRVALAFLHHNLRHNVEMPT